MTDQPVQEPKSKLDALYGDDPAPAPASPEPGRGETQQPPPAKPEGAAAAAKPGEGAPPAPEEDEADVPETVAGLKAALVATRRKAREQQAADRKERDAKLAQLEKSFKELEARTPKVDDQEQGEDMPDPIVDPKGFAQALDDRNFVRLVQSSRADMIDEMGQDEFVAKEEAFRAAVAANPQLAQRLRNSRDPARYAYTQGKKFLEAQQAKPDDEGAAYEKFKAKLAEDFDLVPRPKPNGQAGAHATSQQQPASPARSNAPRLPTSLADVPSGGPRANEKPAGRRSLTDLYGD